jgi:sugar lactone lactonase YvrE
MNTTVKYSIIPLFGIVFLLFGCSCDDQPSVDLPTWTFSSDMLYPSDGSLYRPEDGVALPGGRLIVTDQGVGLRLIEADGSHRPFGKMADAGYVHNPPGMEGCANGVTINPAGTHLIVADVFRGGIYEIEVATEDTRKVYQHTYGVNMARADSLGGIWFSQSTRNLPEQNGAGLWESVWVARPDGALCYLPPAKEGKDRKAVVLVDDFVFANGLIIDEPKGILYISETFGNKVRQFDVDLAAGTVSGQAVAVEVGSPDNLELDKEGRLWIACPLRSEIVVFDPATGSSQSVFRISTQESERLVKEIETRLESGVSWADLAVPGLSAPAPGLMTGIILDEESGAVYATGLGNAIIKLE